MNVTYLRNLIGYVGQEPVLFGTTVRQNILYGSRNHNNRTNEGKNDSYTSGVVSEEAPASLSKGQEQDEQEQQRMIENAAKISNAHNFITSFTDGYNTQVGDKGKYPIKKKSYHKKIQISP